MTKQFRKFAPQAQIFAIDKYDIQYVATHQSDQYLEKELQVSIKILLIIILATNAVLIFCRQW